MTSSAANVAISGTTTTTTTSTSTAPAAAGGGLTEQHPPGVPPPPPAPTREAQHAWEETDAQTLWSAVQEDADGNLISTTASLDDATLVRLRRKRLARSDYARSNRRVVRDMIRYVYLVVDLSRTMNDRDPVLPPSTRLDAVLTLVGDFVNEYYDQNPLSHLGMVVVRDGEAEMVTRLTGSRSTHGAALLHVRREVNRAVASNPTNAGGEFSLQNGLEVAGRSLGHMPRHGSREIVVLMGALATCDPGDVLVETLPRLVRAGVRVSCVALSAEVHVCRKIAETTGGIMGVCLDRAHLRDLVMGQCVPPPARPEEVDATTGHKKTRTCEFVQMGFPARRTEDVPSLIHASGGQQKTVLAKTGYLCPRCLGKSAELPTDCAVCGLKLVLAPHLARSFHHLFPVPPFVEVPEEVEVEVEKGEKSGAGHGSDLVGSVPPSSVTASSADAAAADASAAAPSSPSSSSSFHVGSGAGARRVEIDATLLRSSADCDRCCYACLKVIGAHEGTEAEQAGRQKGGMGGMGTMSAGSTKGGGGGHHHPNNAAAPKPESLRFQCPDCRNVFCADCDAYLHETLHNCPGCLCSSSSLSY